MSTRRRLAWVVAAVAAGLLAMHVLPGLAGVHHAAAAAAPEVAQHDHHAAHAGTRGAHDAAPAHRARTGGDPVTVDDAPAASHLHWLLDCILFVVAGSALALAAVRTARSARAFGATSDGVRTSPMVRSRPPPTAVRLSLVGLARC